MVQSSTLHYIKSLCNIKQTRTHFLAPLFRKHSCLSLFRSVDSVASIKSAPSDLNVRDGMDNRVLDARALYCSQTF